MPELCRFFGLIINMYHNDHSPPHFHVRYGEFWATIEIESERVRGYLPRRATSLALEWARPRRAELMKNWHLARAGAPLIRLTPLE